jgi:capsular exopolysaccharide synthesis family protein
MAEILPTPMDQTGPAHAGAGGTALTLPGGPAPLAPAPVVEEEKTDWRRYLTAVQRYKWLIALTTALGIAGGVMAGRFIEPVYVAQATIWIEVPQRGQSAGPIQQGQLLQSYGWVDLLRSYVVLDEVVRSLRLYLRPETPADSLALAGFTLQGRFRPGVYELQVSQDGARYTLLTAAGAVIAQGATGDSIGLAAGFSWAPSRRVLTPGRAIKFSVTSPRDASRQLALDLHARPAVDGSFMKLELAGSDPTILAATVNGVIHRFVDVAAELKREKLTELSRILAEQLQTAQNNLRDAEIALESFRVRTITLPQDPATPVSPGLAQTANPVFQNFFQMRIERDQLSRDREAIGLALAQGGDSGVGSDALRFIPAVSGSEVQRALDELTAKEADLRAQRFKYTDAHPPVQRLLSEVRVLRTQTIPTLAGELAGQLEARVAELDRRIGSASAELRQIPTRAIEEGRLERNKATAEALYVNLRQRFEEARLGEASSVPDVRILDEAAVPQKPVTNVGSRFILLGLLAGFGLGVVGAILLDRIDSRVRYPDQVSRELGLTILGAVPRVRGNGAAAQDTAQVVEALRGLRLSLVHAYGSAGPILVTVSSPGSGDGKSFVASNLALAFADAGHRTLLLDGDIRRGGLHRVMNADRKPGLTDFLAGKATREQLLRTTSYPNLSFIACGTRTQSGPELLGGATMRELIAGLRAQFAVIIVDSPPLGAGVDPFVLGTLTGNLLLVLRTGVTDREMAEAKLDVLDRLPIRVLGAVLNDVREGGSYRYYSYSYYIAGYEAADEEPDGKEKGKKKLGKGVAVS